MWHYFSILQQNLPYMVKKRFLFPLLIFFLINILSLKSKHFVLFLSKKNFPFFKEKKNNICSKIFTNFTYLLFSSMVPRFVFQDKWFTPLYSMDILKFRHRLICSLIAIFIMCLKTKSQV